MHGQPGCVSPQLALQYCSRSASAGLQSTKEGLLPNCTLQCANLMMARASAPGSCEKGDPCPASRRGVPIPTKPTTCLLCADHSQLGYSFFSALATELSANDYGWDAATEYFRPSPDPAIFTARSVLIDMEPKVRQHPCI